MLVWKIMGLIYIFYFFGLELNIFFISKKIFYHYKSEMEVLTDEKRGTPPKQCLNTLILKSSGHNLCLNILLRKEEIR